MHLVGAFKRMESSLSFLPRGGKSLGKSALIALLLLLLIPAIARAEAVDPASSPMPPVDVGLDPGHSRADVGAVGGGLREYDLTLDVATRVGELLRERGLSVALSRYDDNPLTDFSSPDPTDAVRLEQEARIAAVGSARLYVSIHFNGYDDPRVRGAETYFNGDDHGAESRALAESIQGELLAEVRAAGYPLADRGAKEDLAAGKPYGHFFSLRGDMPSALVESMFLTNPSDVAQLWDESIREAVARGIADGISDYLTQYPSQLTMQDAQAATKQDGQDW